MATKTFHRGIRDLKIAAWTAENSYGTAYDVLGARNMSITWVVETDELRGDDVVLDRYTKLVSVTVNIEQASVDLEAADMLLGGTLVSNGDYEDLMTGVDMLVQQGIADPDRLALRGWSYGGILGGWTITQTDRFKAASIGAGVTSLRSKAPIALAMLS